MAPKPMSSGAVGGCLRVPDDSGLEVRLSALRAFELDRAGESAEAVGVEQRGAGRSIRGHGLLLPGVGVARSGGAPGRN